ncbi:MHF histone-fold complex component [Metarhizium acridum]|nr:MHF histone-fold complex component [Metarhizium acridum]
MVLLSAHPFTQEHVPVLSSFHDVSLHQGQRASHCMIAASHLDRSDPPPIKVLVRLPPPNRREIRRAPKNTKREAHTHIHTTKYTKNSCAKYFPNHQPANTKDQNRPTSNVPHHTRSTRIAHPRKTHPHNHQQTMASTPDDDREVRPLHPQPTLQINNPQRLKSALWFAVGQIVDEECLRRNRNATPQFIGALTEMVWTQIGREKSPAPRAHHKTKRPDAAGRKRSRGPGELRQPRLPNQHHHRGRAPPGAQEPRPAANHGRVHRGEKGH